MIMKSKTILLIATVLLSWLFGQEENETIKLDSVLSNQELMLENQSRIFEEVKYVDNLAGKNYGVEFNFVRFLMASASEDATEITGSFSLFDIDRRVEIAFPIFYSRIEDLTTFHIDSHYRRFLGQHQNGFYLSAGVRYSRITGYKRGAYFWNEEDEIITENKVGVVFGIGYRIFGRNGLYWGFSLFGGRYFSDETEISGFTLSDGKIILDMELLKFGIAF